MLPQITTAVDAALRQEHRASIRGEILSAGLVRDDIGFVPLAPSGQTTMDRTQLVRRKSSVTVPDPAWRPTKPSDPLAAFGKEMRLWYVIAAPTLPQPVPVPIITAHILDSTDDTPFAGVSVSLVDRMWRVTVDEFDTPRVIRGSALTNLRALITESVPWMPFDVHPAIAANDVMVPAAPYNTRADAIDNLATSLGADLPYCDALGVCRIWPVPDVNAAAVWQVNAGENGVLVKATRRRSSQTPNSFRAIGQAAAGDPPMSDLIVDDDPASPTFYGGISSATGELYPTQYREFRGIMRTKLACDIVGRAMRDQYKGQAQSIDFGSVCNPGLEDGDVVAVTPRTDEPTTSHLPDSWSLNHEGSGMTATSRSRTLADLS